MICSSQYGDYTANNAYLTPPFKNADIHQNNIGFLIEGCSLLDAAPLVVEARRIAERNHAAEFDCMHVFDVRHLSSFFSQLPQVFHKRAAYYIVRIFLGVSHIDDIVDTILMPAFREMTKTGEIYYEVPGWLNELYADSIHATIDSIQKELGGYEFLEAEFELFKQKFLVSANEVSAAAFQKYLDDNPSITEIYGLIGKINLYFLDANSTKVHSSENQRHRIYKHGDRQISVYLFGGNSEDTHHFEAMQLFCLEKGLRLPYGYDVLEGPPPFQEEALPATNNATLLNPTLSSQSLSVRVKDACEEFIEWHRRHPHYQKNCERALEWLHEGDRTERFIQTYEDFVQFVSLAQTKGYPIHSVPEKDIFEKAVRLRHAKQLQSEENSYVSFYKRPLKERLEKVKKTFEAWMKINKDDNGNLVPSQNGRTADSLLISTFEEFGRRVLQKNAWGYDIDRLGNMPDLQLFNLAMDIFNAIHTKKVRSSQCAQDADFAVPDVGLEAEKMFKIIASRTLTLLDFLPVAEKGLHASNLHNYLKKYLEIVMLSQEALECFARRDLSFFDPLVGENACQIRASMLAEILNKEGLDEQLQYIRKRLAQHALDIKAMIDNLPKTTNADSFRSFLIQKNALFELSEEMAVIISSYILTQGKIVEYKPNDFGVPSRHERMLAKTFNERNGMVTSFANSLIAKLQKKLSEVSVIYMQRLARGLTLSNEEKTASMKVFEPHVKTDERHRKTTPCYPTMRLILKNMFINKIPIVLKIEQFMKGQSEPYGTFALMFGNQGPGNFSIIKDPAKFLQKGAMFIHAKSITDLPQSAKALEEKIDQGNVADLILSAAADHPQYGSDDNGRPEDIMCEQHRKLADKVGTSRRNPSLFMIEHIQSGIINYNIST